MVDQNIGLLEQCPPAIDTGALCGEAMLNDFRVQQEPKEQPQSKPTDYRIQCEDPASDKDVLIATTEPIWLIKAKYMLDQVGALPDRWDAYGSPALDPKVYQNALRFLEFLKYEEQVPTVFVIPVSGGGVQLEWQFKGRELEVEFSQLDTVGYLKVFKNKSMEEGEFPPENSDVARNLIQWLLFQDRNC